MDPTILLGITIIISPLWAIVVLYYLKMQQQKNIINNLTKLCGVIVGSAAVCTATKSAGGWIVKQINNYTSKIRKKQSVEEITKLKKEIDFLKAHIDLITGDTPIEKSLRDTKSDYDVNTLREQLGIDKYGDCLFRPNLNNIEID